MKIFFLLLSMIFFNLIFSCNSNSNNDLYTHIDNISKEIQSNEFSRIKKVCTKNGYKSILNWSDSLDNKHFFEKLVRSLSFRPLSFHLIGEVTFEVFLYDEYPFIRTSGILTIIIIDKNVKIEKYEGALPL
jgi:hypothetical protein